MYHNSNPFVFVEYTKRYKRYGCMSKFDNPKFVIRNERGRTSTVVGTNCQPASVQKQPLLLLFFSLVMLL